MHNNHAIKTTVSKFYKNVKRTDGIQIEIDDL